MIDVFSPQCAEHVRAQLAKIKGRSTIALFEGSRKVHEQSNDNMVTDWIAKLFNLPQSIWMYNTNSFHTYLNSLMPIATRLMGGVLLWDDVLPEDANTVYPPAGIGCVGYAGAGYSGTNPYRGTYNANESGVIEGGYRHVFDFATDKSNGTIQALSLTSAPGGNKGWRDYGTDTSADSLFLCKFAGTSLRNISDGDNSFHGYPILSDFGEVTVVYSVYNGVLSRYDLPSAQKILLNDGRSGTAAVKKTVLATVENRSYMYWHDNKFHQVWTSSTTQIRHKSWDRSGTLVDDRTISITGAVAVASNTSSSYAFFIGGNYYIKTSTGWAKLSETGTIIATVDASDSGGSYPIQVNGLVYDPQSGTAFLGVSLGSEQSTVSTNPHLYVLRGDRFCRYYRPGGSGSNYFSSTCTCLQYPWLQCGANAQSSNDFYNYPFDIYPYSMGLATINNLATPVVKTAAQSMKITYEITQGV